MINIKELNISYGKYKIINNLNIHIQKEKFTTIIGPNGCGKSTVIKAIAGLFQDAKENIIVDGKKRSAYERKEFSKKVSFLMQFSEVPKGITVYNLVLFGRLPYKSIWKHYQHYDYERVEWAMKKTYIYDLKNKFVSELSGGERQRVFLALALAQETDILILDEPTNHLDLKYQHKLLELVKQLNQEEKITIICVLHDINQALRYSDEVIIMKNGKIITQGNPNECITKEIMHQVYDIDCSFHKHENYKSLIIN